MKITTRALSRGGAALVALAVVCGGVTVARAGETGTTTGGPHRPPTGRDVGTPSAEALRLAREAPPLVHTLRPESGGGTTSNLARQRIAPTLLALAARAGDATARERALAHVVSTTTPGQEPSGAGGLTAQDEMAAYALLALARQTPSLWSALDATTRARADLVMTAALVGGAFTTSDANPYLVGGLPERTVEGNTNVGRDWNPNYREGMFGAVLAGRAYFGEGRARQLLRDFDLDAFLASAEAGGLTNLTTIWGTSLTDPDAGAPTGDQIAAAVDDWTAYGDGVDDPMGILETLAVDTFAATVGCGLNDGAGVVDETGTTGGMLLTGCAELPHRGEPGMIREFDTTDADGPRSSAFYAFSTQQGTVLNQVLARATGVWEPGRQADRVRSLSEIGVADFFYKIDHGYANYSLGRTRGVMSPETEGYFWPLHYSAWYDVY